MLDFLAEDGLKINMNKIIIDNRTELDDREALTRALQVVAMGRTSTTGKVKHYCHLAASNDGFLICCDKRGKSDRIIILRAKN